MGVTLRSSSGHSPVDNSALKRLAHKVPTKTATVPLIRTSTFQKPFSALLYSNTRPLQNDIDIMRIRILSMQLAEIITRLRPPARLTFFCQLASRRAMIGL